MKYRILVLCVALALLATCWPEAPKAQGELPTITLVTQASTTNCCRAIYCSHCNNECASQSFVAPTDTVYYLKAAVVCSGGLDCRQCRTCVWVEDTNGNHMGANCHTQTTCFAGDCSNYCTTGAVRLGAGTTYILRVCKYPCDDHTCDQCSSQCTAWGYVYLP